MAERMEGLGDLIAAATKAVGVQPCAKCQERRDALNRWFRFARGRFGVSLFQPYRGSHEYDKLLAHDPKSHPWLRRGLTPAEIEKAQKLEREVVAG